MKLDVDIYTDCTRGERDPALFQTLPGGESLFILADGSEMAFAHSFQPIMDVIKGCFAESLARSTGSIRERLAQGVVDLGQAMDRRFPSSDRFGDKSYTATFIAVVIADDRCFLAWIGSQQAKLFRDRRCIKATVPHVTIVHRPGQSDFIVTDKVLSTSPGQVVEPPDIEGPWSLASEDVLVIADHRLFASIPDDEIATVLSKTHAGGDTSAARSLVEAAQAKHRHFASTALIASLRE